MESEEEEEEVEEVAPAPPAAKGFRKRPRAQEEPTEVLAAKKPAPAREQKFVAAL